MEIVEQFRPMKSPKSDYEVIAKVLASLSATYDDVAALLEQVVDLKNMTLNKFVEFCYAYEINNRGSYRSNVEGFES